MDRVFAAKAIDEMQRTPWRPPAKHWGIKIRAHVTDEEGQGDDEEEPEDIQMDIIDEEDPGGTAEDTAKKQDVRFSRIGQSCNFTIKARHLLKYGPRLGCLRCKYITGGVATQPGHSKECKVRIMVEMKKGEKSHRTRKWYVSIGSDEGEFSFKDHDAERAREGGTPGKQGSRFV